MALHDDLLALARDLVDRNPGAGVEANLRRGISTAYYALFHLLVHEATTKLVQIVALRPRIARAFDHRTMKNVSGEYAACSPNAAGQLLTASGQPLPKQLQDVASAFVDLQQARHQADYDTGTVITQAQADTDVMRAELAFMDWAAIQADPAADTFLAELFCRGIPKR